MCEVLYLHYSVSYFCYNAAVKGALIDILSIISLNQYEQMQAVPPVYVAAKSFWHFYEVQAHHHKQQASDWILILMISSLGLQEFEFEIIKQREGKHILISKQTSCRALGKFSGNVIDLFGSSFMKQIPMYLFFFFV